MKIDPARETAVIAHWGLVWRRRRQVSNITQRCSDGRSSSALINDRIGPCTQSHLSFWVHLALLYLLLFSFPLSPVLSFFSLNCLPNSLFYLPFLCYLNLTLYLFLHPFILSFVTPLSLSLILWLLRFSLNSFLKCNVIYRLLKNIFLQHQAFTCYHCLDKHVTLLESKYLCPLSLYILAPEWRSGLSTAPQC